MRLIVVYYNNMSPERVKSKRESMRNVERFLYVNTIAAENLGAVHMSRASPANRADLSHENLYFSTT